MFLSGGQSEEEATVNLNAINKRVRGGGGGQGTGGQIEEEATVNLNAINKRIRGGRGSLKKGK